MSLVERHEGPPLDAPVLVVALEGWVDAGLAAATALTGLLEQVHTDPVASFDADILLDHRSRRPVLHLVEGVNTAVTWPFTEVRSITDQLGRDLLVLMGAEPDYRWRAFAEAVVALAVELDVRMVVGFGAYPAPVPHTRPARLAVSASTDAVAALVGGDRSTLDVPAGVNAAIERRCAEVGLPAVTLWAQVPHYAAGIAYPAASVLLLDTLGRLVGVPLELAALAEAADATRRRLDALVDKSGEHRQLVQQLEATYDERVVGGGDPEAAGRGTPLTEGGPLPSGDELAAEVERFLRDQGRG